MPEPKRIIIDTNVLVSMAMGRTLFALYRAKQKHHIEFVASSRLLSETGEVLSRSKINKWLTHPAERYIIFISRMCRFISDKEIYLDAPDEKDNFLFDLAIASGAKYIVTGDKLLLSMKKTPGVKVITYSRFRELFMS